MSNNQKNIAQSLNLFGVSSILSASAVPVGAINTIAGSGVLILSMACAAIGARLLVREPAYEELLTPKASFMTSASAVAMGGMGMMGGGLLTVRDIFLDASVGFSSMGGGFAMAMGLAGFYGGLSNLEGPRRP